MKSAIFMINKNCNQNCKFCLNSWQTSKELTLDEKKKVLDRLKESNVEVVAFSGGEPLMSKDLIELVDYAYYKNNFKIVIQTNGTLLNKEFLEQIKGKVFVLEISLEGLEKEHNYLVGRLNFRKVLKNIKLAKNYLEVFTNFTITKMNKDCLEDYVKFLDKLEIKVANFTKLYLSGNALKNKELIPSEKDYGNFLEKLSKIKSNVLLNVQAGFSEEVLKKYKIQNYSRCSIGKEITITPSGSIRLCPSSPINWGDALTSDLNFIKDIKPDNGCLVNNLMEAKCTD